MFWRKRVTSRTGPLLLAAVVTRLPNISGTVTPEALVRRLRTFLDSVEKAAEATGGNVVQFVGNFSLVAWRCGRETGGPTVDPIETGKRVLEVIRSREASGQDPSVLGSLFCVGLARGECIYAEHGGRVLSAMGHAWLRLTREFPPNLGGDGDAIVLDRSLGDSLAPQDRIEVGDGWYRAEDSLIE